jgi:hypothetical protein
MPTSPFKIHTNCWQAHYFKKKRLNLKPHNPLEAGILQKKTFIRFTQKSYIIFLQSSDYKKGAKRA